MNFNSMFLRMSAKLPQHHSGEYRGLNLIIEWPKGSVRTGVDEQGNKWHRTQNADYGYVRGVDGRDGEGLDVYIGEDETSDKVFVVEQLNSKGEVDEYKIMLGFNTLLEATKMYLSHYPENWESERLGEVFEVPFDYVFDKVEEHQEQQKTKQEKTANTAPGTYPTSRVVKEPRPANLEHYIWISDMRHDHIMRGMSNEHTNFQMREHYNPPLTQREYDDATRGYAEVKNDGKYVTLSLSPACRHDFLFYPPSIVARFKAMYPGYKIYTGWGQRTAGSTYLAALTKMTS